MPVAFIQDDTQNFLNFFDSGDVKHFGAPNTMPRSAETLKLAGTLQKKALVLRRRDEVSMLSRREYLKPRAPAPTAATARLSINWFPGICLAAFLTIISASGAAGAQTSAKGLNPAEKWVIAQVTAGKAADLSEQF
jgi:hypothetical protein